MSKNGNSFFQKVPIARKKRTVFNLSYDNAFTAKFGSIIPCYMEDCVPGDKFRISAAPFVRLSPLSSPMMGKIDMHLHYFFVPYRILWDKWEKFITGGTTGVDRPILPYLATASVADVSPDYRQLFQSLNYIHLVRYGSNQLAAGSPKVNFLPLAAYWKIYNDYFRDQNLEPDMFDPDSTDSPFLFPSNFNGDLSNYVNFSNALADGGKYPNLTKYAQRSWRKDLFTSALPWAQRGAAVTLPLGGSAPVNLISSSSNTDPFIAVNANGGSMVPDGDLQVKNYTGNSYLIDHLSDGTDVQLALNPNGRLEVDLSNATAINIEDLRHANAVQRWLERNAIAGSRYKEQILSHFGTVVPDYRLDRPEFIAGTKANILTSQVLQTSQTSSDSALGTLAGQGTGSGIMRPTDYYCREHGVIIGVASIIPEAYYSQQTPRMLLKHDKFDYYYPEFENLGEQAIYNAEIYPSGDEDTDFMTFGYNARYYEYKQHPNEVHGLFRTSQAYWIPQRIFQQLPGLNKDFVHVDPSKESSLNNIFAVTDSNQDQFNCIVRNEVRAIRPMSRFSKFNF